MRSIGVRELKTHVSRVLRSVRDSGETVEVTVRGRVIARLVPASAVRSKQDETATVWADFDELAAQIGATWPADASAAEAVGEARCELGRW